MNVKTISVIFVLVTVLLLAQTISAVDAKHNPKNNDTRKKSEIKSKEITVIEKTTIDDKKKAWTEYRIAFDAWKTAKEAYKVAKISEDQTTIDAKKVILDAAEITKDNALKKYLDAKKKKSR